MATANAYEQLRASILDSLGFAHKRAILFGAAYYLTRLSVIILAALASAKAVGVSIEIDRLQAIFALLVAIITAVETWLKPGERYRVHYEFDDEYRDLRDRHSLLEPSNAESLEALSAQLAETRRGYRKAVPWA